MTILYTDTITAPMEKVFLDQCPAGVRLTFLNPVGDLAEKGSFEEADYYLVTAFKVTSEIIERAPHLKMIQRTGAGYDDVDIKYAAGKGIPVALAAGTNASSVAELAVAHILALYRKLHILNADAKEGIYDSWKYRHQSFEIFGKTIGVVGAGAIGRAVMERLGGFAPRKMLYYDIVRLPLVKEEQMGVRYCELDDLMAESDIVTIHLPLLESTRGLISKDRIGRMKREAILINTARGPIVDQQALLAAVREGRIQGAGLDVYDPEPYAKGDEVLAYDNITTTPHIGAATVDNYKRSIKFCMENILRYERGETPLHIVNGVGQAKGSD